MTKLNVLCGGRAASNTGPAERPFLDAVQVEFAARRIDDVDHLVPRIVIVAGDIEGASAAVVYIIRSVLVIPRTYISVVQEYVVAVIGIGYVFIDQSHHSGGGAGLEPRFHGQRKCIQAAIVGDGHKITRSIEG